MSNSEEETAFKSADEGEDAAKPAEKPQTKKATQAAAKTRKKQQRKGHQEDPPSMEQPGKDLTEGTDKADQKTTLTAQKNAAPEIVEASASHEETVHDTTKKEFPSAEAESTKTSGTKDSSSHPEKSPITGDEKEGGGGGGERSEAVTKEEEAESVPKRERTPTRKVARQNDKSEIKEDEERSDSKEDVLDRLSGAAKTSGWGLGGWSDWGTSVLSAASTSVTTLSHSVGEGFQQVMDTVESSLGAPELEDLADTKDSKPDHEVSPAQADSTVVQQPTKSASEAGTETSATQEDPAQKEGAKEGGGSAAEGNDAEEGAEAGGEGGWWSGWGVTQLTGVVKQTSNIVQKTVTETSQAVHKTGKTLVTGSLDVLETIGKKTYDVIAEGDHGLKQTIKSTKDNKPNLSQLLREAKEEADVRSKQEVQFEEERKSHFGAQFDDFQGLVQLEALEILSNQAEGRVQGLLSSMPKGSLSVVKKELISLKDAFQLDDLDSDDDEGKDHEFDRLMMEYVGQVGVNTSPEKIIHVQEKTRKLLMDCSSASEDGCAKDPKEIHQLAIQALAEFTARAVEQFLKVSQLVLLDKTAPLPSFRTKAINLANATKTECAEVGILSTKFTECLNSAAESSEERDSVNPLITNVYLEATNSSTYIQDAFQLTLPVLQQGAIQAQQPKDS